ncbi:hypothetical protein BH11MYX3_BH11MYX3_14010 [soil metagenome]
MGNDKKPDVIAPAVPRTFAAVIRRDFRTRQLDCHPFAQRGEQEAPPPPPAPRRDATPVVVVLPEPTTVGAPPRRVAHTVARSRKPRASSSGEHVLELSIDDSD